MSDCMINPYSSGVCVLGTKSCVMKHTGIVERDKRITELEAEHRDCLHTITDMQSKWDELQVENKRLLEMLGVNSADPYAIKKDAERYQWGLEHPSLMANFFIKWKTRHDHYNHRNPGIHPSDAIDAMRKTAVDADEVHVSGVPYKVKRSDINDPSG